MSQLDLHAHLQPGLRQSDDVDVVQLHHCPTAEAPAQPEAVAVGEVEAESTIELVHTPLRSNAACDSALSKQADDVVFTVQMYHTSLDKTYLDTGTTLYETSVQL